MLAVEIRDPGRRHDARAIGRRFAASEQPLTYPVAHAVAGKPGVERRRLSRLSRRRQRGGLDLVARVRLRRHDRNGPGPRHFAPLSILRAAFWTLFGLLSAAALAMLGLDAVGRPARAPGARGRGRGRATGPICARGENRRRGHGERLSGPPRHAAPAHGRQVARARTRRPTFRSPASSAKCR